MRTIETLPMDARGLGGCHIDWGCSISPEGATAFRARAVRLLTNAVAVETDRLWRGDTVDIELDIGGSTILAARGRVALVGVGSGSADPETAIVEFADLGRVERSILDDAMRDGARS